MMRYLIRAGILMVAIWLLSGCGLRRQQPEKLEELEYTILSEQEIPEEFLAMLEEKKEGPMMLTWLDPNGLFLGVGYGAQPTTGYSITVDALYLAPDGIYLDTTLYGPRPEETVTQTESWPYLVLKTERREEPVIFE